MDVVLIKHKHRPVAQFPTNSRTKRHTCLQQSYNSILVLRSSVTISSAATAVEL